jgi:hypothetical protein
MIRSILLLLLLLDDTIDLAAVNQSISSWSMYSSYCRSLLSIDLSLGAALATAAGVVDAIDLLLLLLMSINLSAIDQSISDLLLLLLMSINLSAIDRSIYLLLLLFLMLHVR